MNVRKKKRREKKKALQSLKFQTNVRKMKYSTDKYDSFNSGLRNWLNNCQMGETLLDKSSCENKFPEVSVDIIPNVSQSHMEGTQTKKPF